MVKYNKILVPVVDATNGKEALDIACALAKPNNGLIYILNVISVSRDKPLDSDMSENIKETEIILSELEEFCKKDGVDVRTELLQAREVGSAIVEESVDKAVDLVLLSMNYKVRFGEFCFGNVMPYVMQHCPCPVLLFHNNLSAAIEE